MSERGAIETLLLSAYEARVRGDLDEVMSFFHPDCRFHFMGSEDLGSMCRPQTGCAAVREQLAGLIGIFAFSKFRTLGLVVEGDRASLHWSADVTHVPTGRTQRFEAVDLVTVEGGKVRSLTQFTDTAGVMRLGSA